MSEPMAASRVNAARALREFPELEEKLQSGALSLTAVHKAQVSFKKDPKSKSEKREILSKLENKSTREVDKILAPESIKKLSFEVTPELEAELERLKEIWGISDLTQLIEKMAKISLKHCDPLKKAERAKPPTRAPELRNRYIPASVRHPVWKRDQGACTFTDKNGRRCGSRYRLQLDHVVPFALGGEHTVENLRLRCPAHNQLHAVECFGTWVYDKGFTFDRL